MTPNSQQKLNREDAGKKSLVWLGSVNSLTLIGLVMTFLGFVFPGWLWLLNTPGDTEMVTLLCATICGILGVILTLIGFAFFGKKSQ